MGCTVGVVHIPGGMLFFKNRDLSPHYLVNRITVFQSTPEFHALRGVNLKTGDLEGVSIGVNRRGICVANTHIVSTPDVTYDLLCERLVREVQQRQDVPRIVEGFVAHNAVQGGRILVCSPAWTLLIEVLKEQFVIEEIPGNVAITNDFALIRYGDPARAEMHAQSSASRLEVANRMVGSLASARGLKAMLRSHVPEKSHLSICSHWPDGGGTESSHIIQVQEHFVAWSWLTGHPCEDDYHTVQLFD
ncbi:MAG: hypothetical protein ACOYZ7_08190 [Chloroflexota bacterium]